MLSVRNYVKSIYTLGCQKKSFTPVETSNTHIQNPRLCPCMARWSEWRTTVVLGATHWQLGQLDPLGDGWIRRCTATTPQYRTAVITVWGRSEGLGLGVWPWLAGCPLLQGPGALAQLACT